MRFSKVMIAIVLIQSLAAKAEEATNSEAFWLWLSEYSQVDGEVLDPLMLEEVLSHEYQQMRLEKSEHESSTKPIELIKALESLDMEPNPKTKTSPLLTEGK
ncbi:hypothetical protein [Aurantivibrio plasticivorans]